MGSEVDLVLKHFLELIVSLKTMGDYAFDVTGTGFLIAGTARKEQGARFKSVRCSGFQRMTSLPCLHMNT